MDNISIINYIEFISYRPQMYLIENTFEELVKHISYFISFKRMFGLILGEDMIFIDLFPKWIDEKYNPSHENNIEWDKIISAFEKKAMDIFFEEVRLFSQSNIDQ